MCVHTASAIAALTSWRGVSVRAHSAALLGALAVLGKDGGAEDSHDLGEPDCSGRVLVAFVLVTG